METLGRLSLRSSRIQGFALEALRKMALAESGYRECLSSDGRFRARCLLRTPAEWSPPRTQRICKLLAPANGLNDAPGAFRNTSHGCLLQKGAPLAMVGLEFQVSSIDPCLHLVFRAVGALTTHTDKVLGRGEPGVLVKVRKYLGRGFGDLEVRGKSFVNVRAAAGQD